ncbi:MAG: hypothetical protein LBH98_03165 [Chitinispirillales bacterium]|jgi:hypothetical protein|nr:hypothetical protein [Chitinispirillales bacterium]
MAYQFDRDYLCAFAAFADAADTTLEYQEKNTVVSSRRAQAQNEKVWSKDVYQKERRLEYKAIDNYFDECITPPFHFEFDFTYDINNPCGAGNITAANVDDFGFNKNFANQILTLFAGYKDRELGLIGHHQVVSRQTRREGADTLTVFQTQVLPAIDRKQNIDWHCPAGANFLKNIVQLCERFDIEAGHSVEQLYEALSNGKEAETEAKKEYSASGTFVQIMDDLCEKLQTKWLFAPADDPKNPNRRVEIFTVDANGFCFPFSTGGISQMRISQESGLTKFPTPDVKVIYDGNSPVVEYSGETLLNPLIKVGTRLIIEDVQGKKSTADMYVSKVRHQGSFYGDFWCTTFSGRPAQD